MNQIQDTTENKAAKGKSSDRAESFVRTVIKRCMEDKGYAARLRRADNPATEYQSWEILASFGVDLEKDYERLPFAVVGAAIAKVDISENGDLSLGNALARCYKEGNESSPAKTRLRRLLACQNTTELCRVLRPILSLLASKGLGQLDYAQLLRELLYFKWRRKDIQGRWAMDFYLSSHNGGLDV